MYEFKPQRTNDKAQKLIILFFIGAAALFLLTLPLGGLPFLWVIQLLAIILLAAAVFLVTRYVSKTYEYSVESSEEGGADLVVTEVSSGGKRRLTVCRVSLSGIESARLVEGGDEGLKAIRRARKRIYDYRPDIAPEKSIFAVAREGGEEYLILLAYDGEFLSILRKDGYGGNI